MSAPFSQITSPRFNSNPTYDGRCPSKTLRRENQLAPSSSCVIPCHIATSRHPCKPLTHNLEWSDPATMSIDKEEYRWCWHQGSRGIARQNPTDAKQGEVPEDYACHGGAYGPMHRALLNMKETQTVECVENFGSFVLPLKITKRSVDEDVDLKNENFKINGWGQLGGKRMGNPKI